MRVAAVALLLAAGILPVSAECGTFGMNFGACLNWCYDTNPGAERYIVEGIGFRGESNGANFTS
ncbi:hypothetical protein QIS74_03503 [Colletotrichum tabaci]|uniref:Uncharacterized protein n=1 Tax=Colletotrichum tabaci TaxID=1209068 RepID=A0AAV9TKG0_9PEZI